MIRVTFRGFRYDEALSRFVLKGRADNAGKQLARACEVHFDVVKEASWSSILAGTGTWQDQKGPDYRYKREGPTLAMVNAGDWREFWATIEWDPRPVVGTCDLGPLYSFPVGAEKGRYIVVLVVTYGNNNRAYAAAGMNIRCDLKREMRFPQVADACQAEFRLSPWERLRLRRLLNRVNYHELVRPT